MIPKWYHIDEGDLRIYKNKKEGRWILQYGICFVPLLTAKRDAVSGPG
jgi:hypothetical protein